MSLFAYTLFSSSSGNSSLFGDGNNMFLIDAGVSAKRLTCAINGIGADASRVDGIFITHDHTDHISGVEVFCRKTGICVHAPGAVADKIKAAGLVAHDRIYTVTLGDFTVSSFPTSHDTRTSVGYTVVHKSGLKLGYATDTGVVTDGMYEALRGCYGVILESNYDERMLSDGAYPPDVKERIASDAGHLSNRQCAEFLPYLYGSGVRRVLLAHISPENNTPELALSSALAAKEKYGLDELYIECAKSAGYTKLI